MVKVCNITKTVGWLLAVCRPAVGWQSTKCWLSVGRLSVDGRPTVGQQLANSRPTDSQQLADCWPTVSFGNCSSLLPKLRRIWSNAVDYLLECLCIIFQPNHFPQLMNTVAKIIISQGNGKFVAYIHHVWNAKAKISWQEWGGCMWE